MNPKKSNSKDLLRLEKNYFPNIYHEDNFNDEKEFLINKILRKPIQKPKMSFLPQKSDSNFL